MLHDWSVIIIVNRLTTTVIANTLHETEPLHQDLLQLSDHL
jgi:hypothetical protein